jgi:exopolysaccharide production protein ExoZ
MSQSIAKIRNLQVLRAYAALAVVLFHTNCTPPGIHPMGLFGVHLFFVLSGYVMASICDSDTRAFVRRRLVRIIPMYWTLTLVVYLLAWKAPHLMNTTRAIPSELLKSLLFVPFLKSNGLYQPVLFVGWSVNYEMFFYMMLSIAVAIYKRRAAVLGAAIMVSVMTICSLFAKTSTIAKFYSNSILFECILGVAAYYCVRAASRRFMPVSKPVLLTMAIASLVLLPAIEGFQVLASMPMVVRFGPLCFVLICSTCLLALSGADMRAGTLVLLGDASYVMYLVHGFIETFLNRIMGKLNPIFHIDTPIGCLMAVVSVMAISVFLYLRVDKPTVVYLNRVLCGRQRQDIPLLTSPATVAPVGTAAVILPS